MPKRTICIQSSARISVEKGSLIVKLDRSTARIPLEDIWVLIVESHNVQITSHALAEITDAGIGTMICGRNHMPNGLLLPLGAHSRHAAIVEDQLLMSKPLKKRLWQRIVQTKISNQAAALDLLGLEGADRLYEIARHVLSGDTDNREAVAASLYFDRLIEDGTRRSSGIAAALDYGYAVVRAGIARTAVSGGWLVSRGIHHCNDLNAFNLVDDFIEPFRPVADLIAYKAAPFGGDLEHETKKALCEVFEYEVMLDGQVCCVQSAITAMFASFRQAVLEDDASLLLLPSVLPLQRAEVRDG